MRASRTALFSSRLSVMDLARWLFILKHILTLHSIFFFHPTISIQYKWQVFICLGILLQKRSSRHTELASVWRHSINWIVQQLTLFMFFLMFWKSLLIEKHKESSKFHFYFLLHFLITSQLLLERGPAKKRLLVHCMLHFNTWTP